MVTCSFSVEHPSFHYIQNCRLYMSSMAWKCYRCDLTFKEKSDVILHEDLSKHPVQQIELISNRKTIKQSFSQLYLQTLEKLSAGHGLVRKHKSLRHIDNIIKKLLSSKFVYINNSKMELFGIMTRLSLHGTWEKSETEIIKKIIKEGDYVLDLGANIGYYTLLFSRLVGDKGKVFAFEPDPKNFSVLKRNIELNNYKNVILVQKAVSNKNGNTNLFLSDVNTGDHRLFADIKNKKSIVIQTVKLDDYFKDLHKPISFIKMDIQGSEGLAIDGMKKLLSKNHKPTLLTEFWKYGLINSGIEPNSFLQNMSNLGFSPFLIDEKKESLEQTTIEELEDFPSTFEKYANLLWVK